VRQEYRHQEEAEQNAAPQKGAAQGVWGMVVDLHDNPVTGWCAWCCTNSLAGFLMLAAIGLHWRDASV
jgi:hypothetical protein